MTDKQFRVDDQLQRLKEAAGADTDIALTTLLGVAASGAYNARERGRIPHKWFVTISTKYGVNLEWLVSGTGPRSAEEPKQTGACPRCAEIQARLDLANERLYAAMKENGELKAEIGKLREELVALKNEPSAAAQTPMASAS